MPTIQANKFPPHGDPETAPPVLNRRGFLKHGSRALGASLATLVLCDLAELMELAEAAGLSPQ